MGAQPRGAGLTRGRLLLIPLLALQAGLAIRSWYVTDDAYISFRYARHWAEGLGLRFNLHEPPVEGFSNFVWVAIAAAGHVLGWESPAWMPALSITLACAVTVGVVAALVRLGRASRLLTTAGAAAVAANAAMVTWATSGMETMAWVLALGAGLVAWAVEAPWPLRGAALVVLCASRPEGPAWSVGLVGIGLLARPRSGRSLAYAAAVGLVGAAALLLARHAWFDDWVANTVHAKSGGSLLYYGRGLRYAVAMAIELVVPLVAIPVATATLVRWRGRGALGLREALAVGILGPFLLSVAVGGDWMPFGRFVVVTVPLGVVLVLDAVAARAGERAGAGVGAVLAVVGALPQFDVPVTPRVVRDALHFRNHLDESLSEREWWRLKEKQPAERWAAEGRMLARVTAPDEPLYLLPIGAVAYYAEREVTDRCYLVQRMPEGTRVEAGKRMAGHDSCVRRLSEEALGAGGYITDFGFALVPEAVAGGDAWTDVRAPGVYRTWYRVGAWGGDPAEYGPTFFVDRHRAAPPPGDRLVPAPRSTEPVAPPVHPLAELTDPPDPLAPHGRGKVPGGITVSGDTVTLDAPAFRARKDGRWLLPVPLDPARVTGVLVDGAPCPACAWEAGHLLVSAAAAPTAVAFVVDPDLAAREAALRGGTPAPGALSPLAYLFDGLPVFSPDAGPAVFRLARLPDGAHLRAELRRIPSLLFPAAEPVVVEIGVGGQGEARTVVWTGAVGPDAPVQVDIVLPAEATTGGAAVRFARVGPRRLDLGAVTVVTRAELTRE